MQHLSLAKKVAIQGLIHKQFFHLETLATVPSDPEPRNVLLSCEQIGTYWDAYFLCLAQSVQSWTGTINFKNLLPVKAVWEKF